MSGLILVPSFLFYIGAKQINPNTLKTIIIMKTLTTTILRSDELSCPSCVNNIESELNKLEGVEKATVHFTTGRIEVEHNSAQVSTEDLEEAIRRTGYKATVSPF